MNIFILDYDIDKCAEYHCDKHIVKMPLEAAQMLCTTAWIDRVLGFIPRKLDKHEREELRLATESCRGLSIEQRVIGYLPTMVNHPCTIWARSSLENFFWLYNYAHALNNEYEYRYGKSHKSLEVVGKLPYLVSLQGNELTPFAQAMPDQYKMDDAVQAYRRYYVEEKRHIANWKCGTPVWFQEALY